MAGISQLSPPNSWRVFFLSLQIPVWSEPCQPCPLQWTVSPKTIGSIPNLPLILVNVSLLGNRIFPDVSKVWCHYRKPSSSGCGPYEKRKRSHEDRDPKRACGRWRQRQEDCTKDVWWPPEARKRQRSSSPRAFRGSKVQLTAWLETSGLRMERQYIPVVLRHPVCGDLWQNPRKWIHPWNSSRTDFFGFLM